MSYLNEESAIDSAGAWSSDIEGLEIASESSVYRKLVSYTEHDYTYWAARCRGKTGVIYRTWLYLLGCEVQR